VIVIHWIFDASLQLWTLASQKSLTIGLNGLYLTSLGLPYIKCPLVSIMFRSLVHGCGCMTVECLCMDSYVLIYGEESIVSH
jgi:hypothetical protein